MKLKIRRIRVHIGVNIGAEVRNGFPGPNKELDAEIQEFGVLVRPGKPFATKLIPWSNVIEMDVEEVAEEKVKKQ